MQQVQTRLWSPLACVQKLLQAKMFFGDTKENDMKASSCRPKCFYIQLVTGIDKNNRHRKV